MDRERIINLIEEYGESDYLDFKYHEYDISNRQSELVKDICAFANSHNTETKYIIVGIKKDINDGIKINDLKTITDDAVYQEIIKSSIDYNIKFKYEPFIYDGKNIAIIEIDKENLKQRPFLFKKDIVDKKNENRVTKFYKGQAVIRKGSATDILNRNDIEEIFKVRGENSNKKLDILNDYLIGIINDFNDLIKNMYKAVMEKPLEDNSPILENLYFDITKLYKEINKIDLLKDGYMSSGIDWVEMISNEKQDFEIKLLTWKECYDNKIIQYINKLKEFKKDYFSIIEPGLAKNIDGIVLYEQFIIMQIQEGMRMHQFNSEAFSINGIIEDNNGEFMRSWIGEGYNIPIEIDDKIIIKNYFLRTNLYNMLYHTSKMMEDINNAKDRNCFTTNISYFNNEGTSPTIGSGIMDIFKSQKIANELLTEFKNMI